MAALLTCACGSTWWVTTTEIQIREEVAKEFGMVTGAEYLSHDKRHRLRCAECNAVRPT